MGAASLMVSICALAVLVGCSNPDQQSDPTSANNITLANGVVLPILSQVTRQPKCQFIEGHDISQRKDVVCLEYPGALAQQPDGGIQQRYTNLLLDSGFTWQGGSGVEYFFSWPATAGCSQRFSIASVPKTMPLNKSDWSTVETFVLILSFGRRICE